MRYQSDDQTRKMLDLIREGRLSNKTLLNEQDEMGGMDALAPTDEMMPDEFETAEMDTETDEGTGEDRELEKEELKEEEDKFRQTVHNRVKFNTFKLYPESQNVEWSGEFTDNRIEWNYSLDDSQGVYISCELTQLREDTLKVLQKLSGYYKTWSDEWATRIAEEYNPSSEDMVDGEETTEGGFEPGDDLPDEEPMV
jgi:hypothetical protein